MEYTITVTVVTDENTNPIFRIDSTLPPDVTIGALEATLRELRKIISEP